MEGSITRDTPTKEEQSGDILIRSSRSPSRLALMNKTRLRDIYIYIRFSNHQWGKEAFISPRRIIEKNRSWLTDRLRSSMVERNKTSAEKRVSSEKDSFFFLSLFFFSLPALFYF